MRLIRGWLALTVASALFGTGCAAVRPRLPAAAPQVLPPAAELESALAQRRTAVLSLRALAHMRYRDPEGAHSAREALIVARPDRVRVEVMSFLGSVFVLATEGGALTAWNRQENTVYQGQASPENLWRYIHVGLEVPELVNILLGTPPPRLAAQTTVDFDAQAGAVRLKQAWPKGALVVWFSPEELPVMAEEHGSDGQVLWRVTYANYQDAQGVAVAARIGLEAPMWHRSLDLDLESVDVNPQLDPSVFVLQTPPGTKLVVLDAGAQ